MFLGARFRETKFQSLLLAVRCTKFPAIRSTYAFKDGSGTSFNINTVLN